MKPFGKLSKGKMKIQHIANLNVDFKYLIPNVKLVGIGPQDIYDGNQRLILGLIWSIICFFTLQEFQETAVNSAGDDAPTTITAYKMHLMNWVDKCLQRCEDAEEASGFQDTFADGSAFLGILHAVQPEKT
jgi:hypothetical protein